MLDSTQRTTAAELLWAAERDLAPIDPLTETFPGIDVVDAYEIQLINIRRKIAAGARVRGHKVGLSSPVMQQMMGVDEPDYGHLLDSMVLGQDAPIPAGRYCYPRIEVEIGYVLGSALPGAGCTEADVLAATEYIVPSLELIDSRITDWRIKLADTIADNASSAGVILGEARRTPAELAAAGVDLANIDAVLYSGDGEESRPRQHQRGARQPDRLRRLAGAEGGRLRGEARGRAPHPPRVVHPGDRRAPGHRVPRRVRRARHRDRSFATRASSDRDDTVTKATAAIVGSGNIGTDLMYKLLRSDVIEPRWMIGIDPESPGLKRAADHGLTATAEGVDWLLANERPDLVFEATSAYVHRENAPQYTELGIQAVDLTPAAIGPAVVPAVNLGEHTSAPNVSLITCGGQATIPMVYAVSRVVPVEYAEIVASVASPSAGPGTRANIDEFTKTTARGVETIGGARRGKAIIILNPAEPPMLMQDTIFCAIPADADRDAIAASIKEIAADVAAYVPGYRLRTEPQFDDPTPMSGGSRPASPCSSRSRGPATSCRRTRATSTS